MREDRKSFGFNISSVASERMPTSTALILCRVESLLLRHTIEQSSLAFLGARIHGLINKKTTE